MTPYYEWEPKKNKFVVKRKRPPKRKIAVRYQIAKNSDKEAILRFQVEAEESEPEIWESSEIENLKRTFKAIDFEKENNNFKVILAIADNKVVGTLSMSWYFCLESGGTAGVISGLFVLKNYRLAGIGRGLIEFAKREFRKLVVKKIELIVGLDNLAALAFYKKLGFKIKKIGYATYWF